MTRITAITLRRVLDSRETGEADVSVTSSGKRTSNPNERLRIEGRA